MGGCLKHKTCILSKPLDISFISSVDEDGSILFSTTPKCVIGQIPLLKGLIAVGMEIEVIKDLGEVVCLVKLIFGREGELFRWNIDGIREAS